MISTCVHCKKQFEWLSDGTGYLELVECCHCQAVGSYNHSGTPNIKKSKPLQVAKKWVVRRGELATDCNGMDNPAPEKFDTMKAAAYAIYCWCGKYGKVNETFRIEQVPA